MFSFQTEMSFMNFVFQHRVFFIKLLIKVNNKLKILRIETSEINSYRCENC